MMVGFIEFRHFKHGIGDPATFLFHPADASERFPPTGELFLATVASSLLDLVLYK